MSALKLELLVQDREQLRLLIASVRDKKRQISERISPSEARDLELEQRDWLLEVENRLREFYDQWPVMGPVVGTFVDNP